jgi:hypothetical protein
MQFITRQQFEEFKKFYEGVMKMAPDYRVGQAFLNFFPALDKEIIKEDLGKEYKLYNEQCAEQAWKMLESFVIDENNKM